MQGEEPSYEKLKELIRGGCIGNKFVPVFCGSAFKNKGVQPLLDSVVDYLPSPLDVPPMNVIYSSTSMFGRPSLNAHRSHNRNEISHYSQSTC